MYPLGFTIPCTDYLPRILQHQFTTTLLHDLGIAEESKKFKGYLPKPPKGKQQIVNPYQKIETVVMQTDVKK
jgi:hypothetical protein